MLRKTAVVEETVRAGKGAEGRRLLALQNSGFACSLHRPGRRRNFVLRALGAKTSNLTTLAQSPL
jgi:hypothetical protein